MKFWLRSLGLEAHGSTFRVSHAVQACSGCNRNGRQGHAGVAAEPGPTYRLLSSSFLEFPYRVLNMNRRKDLLRGLRVNPKRGGDTRRIQRP